mgnify:CR=1 FL=1
MVYLTGDTHGELDRFKDGELRRAGKGDLVVVLGDFGFVWARMPERYPSSNGRRQSWEGQSRQDRQRYHAGENGRQSAEHAVMRHAICEAGVRGQTGRPTAYCGRQQSPVSAPALPGQPIACARHLTHTWSRNFARVFEPMPLTSKSWSTLSNRPICVR